MSPAESGHDFDPRLHEFLTRAAEDISGAPTRDEMRRRLVTRLGPGNRAGDRVAPRRRASQRLAAIGLIVAVGLAVVTASAWIAGRPLPAVPAASATDLPSVAAVPTPGRSATPTSEPTPTPGPTPTPEPTPAPTPTPLTTDCDTSNVALAKWSTDPADATPAGPAPQGPPSNGSIYAVEPLPDGGWSLVALSPDGSSQTSVVRVGGEVGLPTVPGNLTWSPDGQALAFTVTTGAWGDDPEQFVPDVFICEDLYVVRPDGLPVRVVHLGQGHGATLPAWSADGTQLAYVTFISSERPNQERGVWPPTESRTIGIVDLRTGTSRTVAACRACRVAAWSPDGTTLVTVHDAGGGRGITFYDSTTGATSTTLLEEESFDSVLWGPDTASFDAIGAGPETWYSVYHINMDPEPHADPPLELVSWGTSVSFWRNYTALSPDHGTVAFLRPSPDGVPGSQLWIAPVGDSALAHPIGDWTEGGFPPTWSPDGARLLLRTPVERSAPQLAVIDRDGNVLQRLAQSRGLIQQSGQPAWQPVWP